MASSSLAHAGAPHAARRRRGPRHGFLVSGLLFVLLAFRAGSAGAICGDVNCSGAVNVGDGLLVAQFDVGLRECGVDPFDCVEDCDIAPAPSGNGTCDIGDALRMAQCDAGLISCTFLCTAFVCPGATPTPTASPTPTPTVTSVPTATPTPFGSPQIVVSGLRGEDIVAGGVHMGTVIYGRSNQGGGMVASPAARVERVFVIENQGSGPLAVSVGTSTDRLNASVSSDTIDAGRVGALVIEVTLPLTADPDSPGPSVGTVTLSTNDPDLADQEIDIAVTWTWQVDISGSVPDAFVTMFVDFGDVPEGASVDRTFVFQTGKASGRVTSISPTDTSGLPSETYSLIANPDPFMSDSFPATQSNQEVPLRFTFRASPGSTGGTFLGIVSFANDDPDEPIIETLVVGYGAPAAVSMIPAELASASIDESTLRTLDGSEITLLSIPSGNDGIAYDPATGTTWALSGTAVVADPDAPANSTDFYLFRDTAAGRPQVINGNLPDDLVGLAVDFQRNLAYVINLSGNSEDVLKITDSGSSSILASGAIISSRLGTDSEGNVYASRILESNSLALTKYSPAGTQLARFAGTSNIRELGIARVGGIDTIFGVDGDVLNGGVGKKLNSNGALLGTFTVVAPFQWLTVDGMGNVLFSDRTSGSTNPQDLTLVTSSDEVEDVGQLPQKTFQGDF